jgi:hypothetical protein
MNAQFRVFLIVLWLVSLAGAYVAGGSSPFGHRQDQAAAKPSRNASVPDAPGSSLRSTIGGEANPPGATGSSALAGAKTHDVGAVIAAVTKALAEGRGSFWGGSMFRILAPLMELSPEEAQAALGEVARSIEDPRQRGMIQSMLLGRMAESDPKAALAEAEKLVAASDGSGRSEGLYFSVIGALATKDPDAAWKWYSDKRESGALTEEGGRMAGMIFSGLAAKDMNQALSLMSGIKDVDERNMAASGIAAAAKDPASWQHILESTNSLQGDAGQEARGNMIRQWASTNFEATTALIQSMPESERGALLDAATSGLVRANPEKAAAFLMQNTPPTQLAERYNSIVSNWGERDANAAGAWLNRQPPSPAQNNARSSFARIVARRDPESAMAWAQTVTEDKQRTDTIRDVYRQWSRRDSESANNALATLNLSAQQVEEIKAAAARQGQGGGGPQFGGRFGGGPPRF